MQKVLYDKYCTAMFSTTYRILSDKDMAHDSLQDAFIQVFRDIKSFKGNSTLGAWIKTIVVRTALRKIKKEKLFVRWEEADITEFVEMPTILNAEYLEKAILSLSSGFRAVFLLIEVEGYSHKEVAKMLDISVGTSKSQLFHAKRKLRDIIHSKRFI